MMEIVKMNSGHVAAIARLEQMCFRDPWSERSIASELDNPLALWLVAEENGEVLGYIGSQSVPPEADVMNVAVHPQHRRRGMAQELVMQLCRALSSEGIECLALEVRDSNAPAIALYEKLGFVRAGVRKNYYRNPKEDAVIMKKSL